MSKRTTNAVARVLADPANRTRTAEEVAESVISKIREIDARSQRIAVIGQISLEAAWPEVSRRRTVVLGPFSARSIPDTAEKFNAITEQSGAAMDAALGLTSDPSTKLGVGHAMLAPIFKTPRQAWDFWREELEPLRGEYPEASVRAHAALPPLCQCAFLDSRACLKHGSK